MIRSTWCLSSMRFCSCSTVVASWVNVSASPRLHRMMLQLQRYTLNVRYVPGKLMYVADTLSRAFIRGEPSCGAPDDMEVLVHNLVENLPPTADKLCYFSCIWEIQMSCLPWTAHKNRKRIVASLNEIHDVGPTVFICLEQHFK